MVEETGFTVPEPFSVIETLVALPPNVFPDTVTGEIPQVLPLEALNTTVGGLVHPHETVKMPASVVHPSVLRTARK